MWSCLPPSCFTRGFKCREAELNRPIDSSLLKKNRKQIHLYWAQQFSEQKFICNKVSVIAFIITTSQFFFSLLLENGEVSG